MSGTRIVRALLLSSRNRFLKCPLSNINFVSSIKCRDSIQGLLSIGSYPAWSRLFCESKQVRTYVVPGSEGWNRLTRNDPERETKLRQVQLEYEINKDSGNLVPEKINIDDWYELIELGSAFKRQRYFKFLFQNEKKDEHAQLKKEKKAEERALYKKETQKLIEEGALVYGLYMNTIFYYYSDSRINSLYLPKLLHAMVFGPQIVIDVGYCDVMTRRECKETAKQILLALNSNREHKSPFHISLYNLKESDHTRVHLKKLIPTIENPQYPLDIHSDCYMEHLPADKLVYLTPDAPTRLKRFDEDKIYIIGGIVDKSTEGSLSFAKAKEQGIKVAKFPLDDYLEWGTGAKKALALNHVLDILLDLRLSGNWDEALKHVPSRKLKKKSHSDKPFIVRNSKHSGMWWDDPMSSRERRKSGLTVKSLFQE